MFETHFVEFVQGGTFGEPFGWSSAQTWMTGTTNLFICATHVNGC